MQLKTTGRKRRLLCHVNLAPGYRGGERQTELLVRELARRGWSQRLIVRRGSPLLSRCRDLPDLELAGVVPNPVPAALAARGAALVHAHEARAVYAAWIRHWLAGTPYVITRRIDHAFTRSRAKRHAYEGASRVVAISAAIAATIEANVEGLECQVVPDAHAGLAENRPPAGTVRGADGPFVVGHVGELDHSHKGQGTLIEAARSLRETHPRMRFVLVGDGRDEQRFRNAARGLDNIEFAGFVRDVGARFASFDVFAFPSLREGLGSSLLDAMAFGLPIVASDVGGIPEIVEDGVNGILVAPGSSRALAGALARLESDAALRRSMSLANREKARAYCAATMASAYEKLYRDILRA